MAKSIKNNFLYNIIVNASSVVFPLITAPYISRVLEPEGVGLFNFANTYSGYFALVALLGIPTYGVREVSKLRNDTEEVKNLVSQLMSISALITLIVTLVYMASIFLVGQLTENYIIFLFAGFGIYLAPFRINWFFQGLEEFGFIAKRTLVVRLLSIVGLFLFVHEKNDLILYVILNVFTGVIADIWNFSMLLKKGISPHFTIKGLKKHLGPLLVLFASAIAISIYTLLDTIMLGFIRDYEDVGYYSTAMHMSKLVLAVITSLSIVVVPRLSNYVKERDYRNINILMGKSCSVISFLSFPTAVGLMCVAPVFVPLFFGSCFEGAVLPLIILSLLIIVIGLNNITGFQILIGLGLDKLYFFSVLAGTFSNFILNLVFIPLWGAEGASFASVIAEGLILLVSAVFVYRKTPVRINSWKEIYKVVLGVSLFYPMFIVLDLYMEGWILIGIFVLMASITYFVIECMLRNESALLVLSLVKVRINSLNNK